MCDWNPGSMCPGGILPWIYKNSILLLAMIITLAVVSVAAPKITTYIEENTELDERITEKCVEHVEKMRRTG